MSSIKTCERLLKRGMLTNLFLPKGIAITMLIDGPHGQGKSAICKQAAEDIGGKCLTIEGGSLKEGEITGLPMASKDTEGNSEVHFVPYITTSKIAKLEKAVYATAKDTGLMDGTVWLDEKGDTHYGGKLTVAKDGTNTYVGGKVIKAKSKYEAVVEGDDNKYKFGEDLPADVKLELIKTHSVLPIVLFIDEMNRTDNQTMKEMMNIVLNKSVNGYDFPWWVFIISAINPCGQDSVYSTNEMDAAQKDRFLKIKISATFNEWSEYAIKSGLNDDYILALSTVSDKDFCMTNGKGYNESDEEDMTPSPRSHEICAYIYDSTDKINASGFFTSDELKNSETDMRALICGKIGLNAGTDVLKSIRNRANYIDPADILNGKSKTVDPAISQKIHSMATLPQRILSKNVLNYISRNVIKYALGTKDKDIENAKKSNEKWVNINSQIADFVKQLDPATTLLFAKDSVNATINLDDPKYANQNGQPYVRYVIGCFEKPIIDQIVEFTSLSKNNTLDTK